MFSKKFQFQSNQIPIGAPLILTPRIQQNFLTAQMPSPTTQSFFTTADAQQTLTAVPQTSILQNNESNFLQVFAPLQTIDQLGGMLGNGTPLFEYQSQSGKIALGVCVEYLSGFFFNFSISFSYNINSNRYQL